MKHPAPDANQTHCNFKFAWREKPFITLHTVHASACRHVGVFGSIHRLKFWLFRTLVLLGNRLTLTASRRRLSALCPVKPYGKPPET